MIGKPFDEFLEVLILWTLWQRLKSHMCMIWRGVKHCPCMIDCRRDWGSPASSCRR
jgi:hypothetical protein